LFYDNCSEFQAKYGKDKNQISTYESIEASKSPSKSYLQITTDQATVKAGENIVFHAKVTSSVPWLTAQVFGFYRFDKTNKIDTIGRL